MSENGTDDPVVVQRDFANGRFSLRGFVDDGITLFTQTEVKKKLSLPKDFFTHNISNADYVWFCPDDQLSKWLQKNLGASWQTCRFITELGVKQLLDTFHNTNYKTMQKIKVEMRMVEGVEMPIIYFSRERHVMRYFVCRHPRFDRKNSDWPSYTRRVTGLKRIVVARRLLELGVDISGMTLELWPYRESKKILSVGLPKPRPKPKVRFKPPVPKGGSYRGLFSDIVSAVDRHDVEMKVRPILHEAMTTLVDGLKEKGYGEPEIKILIDLPKVGWVRYWKKKEEK